MPSKKKARTDDGEAQYVPLDVQFQIAAVASAPRSLYRFRLRLCFVLLLFEVSHL